MSEVDLGVFRAAGHRLVDRIVDEFEELIREGLPASPRCRAGELVVHVDRVRAKFVDRRWQLPFARQGAVRPASQEGDGTQALTIVPWPSLSAPTGEVEDRGQLDIRIAAPGR